MCSGGGAGLTSAALRILKGREWIKGNVEKEH